MENIGTEHIYLNLKLKSKNIEKNIKSAKPLKDAKTFKKKTTFPKDDSLWLYKSFSTYINKNNFECPLITSEKWEHFKMNKNIIITLP